jgi:hypothetical protein
MTVREALLRDIENILRRDPAKMYSREELLNLLAHKKRDSELEGLLAELEIGSLDEKRQGIRATCMAGTVYYKWGR